MWLIHNTRDSEKSVASMPIKDSCHGASQPRPIIKPPTHPQANTQPCDSNSIATSKTVSSVIILFITPQCQKPPHSHPKNKNQANVCRTKLAHYYYPFFLPACITASICSRAKERSISRRSCTLSICLTSVESSAAM